jgi:hypothetical protein
MLQRALLVLQQQQQVALAAALQLVPQVLVQLAL